MGTPPPTKARQVLKKGEVRSFVLAGLDPPRRVAELAIPAGRACRPEADRRQEGCAGRQEGTHHEGGSVDQEGRGEEGGRAGEEGDEESGEEGRGGRCGQKGAQEGGGEEGGQGQEGARKEGARQEVAGEESRQERGHNERRTAPMTQLPRPADVLPHRPPFLFVTELTTVDPGVSATGTWELTGEEAFFGGHFPGRPTLPGVLMVESMAQLGGIAVLLDQRYAGKLPLFGGIERARFRRQVVPGETLQLQVTMDRLSARAGKGHGRATVGGHTACEAELLFVIVDGGAN